MAQALLNAISNCPAPQIIHSDQGSKYRSRKYQELLQDVGSMASMATGKALGFALWNLQGKSVLYITAGTEVYEGMIIGNTAKGNDMAVNPTKYSLAKKVFNRT